MYRLVVLLAVLAAACGIDPRDLEPPERPCLEALGCEPIGGDLPPANVDASEVEPAAAPEDAPVGAKPGADLPQWPSVAWILTQPYQAPAPYGGVACGRGQRASDNIETLFVAHSESGRCSFRCVGECGDHTATCEAIDGYCDAAGWCRSIHVAE